MAAITSSVRAVRPWMRESSTTCRVKERCSYWTVTRTTELLLIWALVDGPGSASFQDASAVQTDVTFSVQGHYTLRVEASNASAQVSDTIVVTFAAEERDRSFTISAPATLFFEAEDYTLRVGEGLVSRNGSGASGDEFIVAEASQDPAFLEFELIVTSEGYDYYLWVRMMQVSAGQAQLAISLDDGSEQTVTTTANSFSWVRVAQPIPSPAGAYPLRLRATQDGTAWDAVYVTSDPGFAPEDARLAAPILLP